MWGRAATAWRSGARGPGTRRGMKDGGNRRRIGFLYGGVIQWDGARWSAGTETEREGTAHERERERVLTGNVTGCDRSGQKGSKKGLDSGAIT